MALLDEFLGRKKGEALEKAASIEMLQEAMGALVEGSPAPRDGKRCSLDTISGLGGGSKRPREAGAKRYSVGLGTGAGSESGLLARMAGDALQECGMELARGAPEHSKDASDTDLPRIEVVRGTSQARLSDEDGPTIEERRLRIENHATRRIKIPYSLANSARFLPAGLKRISQLFKILDTACRFNERRDLSLVLVKYKGSIERLFKHRLENSHLEQLNFIAGDRMEFVPVTVVDNGRVVKSVTIKVAAGVEIDGLLFDYFTSEYDRWAAEHGMEGPLRTIHPGFDADAVELPRRSIPGVCGDEPSGPDGPRAGALEEDKARARQTASSIYERIKEKERLRREAFKKEQTIIEDYGGRIDSLFVVGAKRAMKLADLIFQLGSRFGCREKVLGSLGNKYDLRKFDGVEYVVRLGK